MRGVEDAEQVCTGGYLRKTHGTNKGKKTTIQPQPYSHHGCLEAGNRKVGWRPFRTTLPPPCRVGDETYYDRPCLGCR